MTRRQLETTMPTNMYTLLPVTFLALGIFSSTNVALAQSITHQINLPSGQGWCSDSMITGLFSQINLFRSQNGVAALNMDNLGMKDAEIRAPQFIDYMATHTPGRGFNPHEGYDTTAASLGYNIIAENLAFAISDPASVIAGWQDALHRAALLASDANVAGVSCVISGGIPFWTYEPGYCPGGSCGSSTPPPPSSSGLDSEEWAFLTLINNYRAQNGAGPLQVSVTLQAASRWMSNDMSAKNYFNHTDSLGRSSGARIAAFGYPYFPWGENIAAGYSSAANSFSQWQNACDADGSGTCTYAHRLNMLNGSFKVIGIARAYGPGATYGWYWTTDFGGVVDAVITPGGGTAPTISSFTSNPSSITTGQSTTLSWNVSGATSLSISSIGSVTGLSSKVVTPSATTTYTLTATNATGSSSAVTTVTVNPVGVDTQPPTAPVITSAAAASATQVNLAWSASTDNVGVTGYLIYRNGGALVTLGNQLSYSDNSVSASTTYTYFIVAFDARGNSSVQSNNAMVTTPSPVVTTSCPAPATNAFTGCYYNNTSLAGNPVLTRTDNNIAFSWGNASPGAGVPAGNFSARWQGNFFFPAGNITFTVTTSDGMRVYIDGTLLLDRWIDQSGATYLFRRELTQGNHLVTVDYYQKTGTAIAMLLWNTPVIASVPNIASFTATPNSLSLGQATSLAWNVTGATSISISGVGDVTGLSSKPVTPSATTTYVLTASNSSGSATASVTVNVASGGGGGGGGDSQAPSTPTITSSSAVSMSQVNLGWTASSDNVGVTGYQIIRNGAVLASVSGSTLSFSDTTVTFNTSYTYNVRAFDAAGNFSGLSNGAVVTTPAPDRDRR